MATAPTNEKGHGGVGIVPWSGMIDTVERTPELQWPLSITVYDMMRRTDSQLAGIMRAISYPIRRLRWHVDPNGAPTRTVSELAEDLGLPIKGETPRPRPRSRGRFSWNRHLQHVLLSPVYGHMFFEQYGQIVDGRWRLRKLAPRMPATISEIVVADDGGLEMIKQFGTGKPPFGQSVEIGVDRLVAYIHEQEGGNWYGSSILRAAYKHWLIKDRLLRVDALKHERNGMGVPWIDPPPNATPAQMAELDRLAQKYKAGEASGGVGIPGSRLRLVGVEGGIPDTLASIRYHDEQESKLMLVQFLDLGTTGAGNRALGDTFVDFFSMAIEAMAVWIADTTTEHVCEDWVDWNDGEDVPSPRIGFDAVEDPDLQVTELVELINAGALHVDEEVKEWIHERHNIPYTRPEDREEEPTPPPAPTPPPPPTEAEIEAARRARQGFPRPGRIVSAALQLPTGRKTRRGLYDHEVAAATDFAAMEARFASARDQLVSDWGEVRAGQIDDLVEQIRNAAELEDVAKVATSAAGADTLADYMAAEADLAAEEAIREAKAQGRIIPKPDLEEAAELLRERADATATLLARSISETAGRQAVQRWGGSLTPGEVADEVRAHLEGLSDAYLVDQLGGALQQATNTGRKEVIDEGDPTDIYGSELLDANTCSNCSAIDGTRYQSIADAENDYPTGGYHNCLGGPRCRGTLVAVYGEQNT